MKDNNSYIAGSVDPHPTTDDHHKQHQQYGRLANARDHKAVNKRSAKVAKVRGVSKKQIDTKQELQESRQRWQNERDVIERIVQLSKKLGHQSTILDLYCAGFEPAEIDAISDILQSLVTTDDDAKIIPWVEAPLELVMA